MRYKTTLRMIVTIVACGLLLCACGETSTDAPVQIPSASEMNNEAKDDTGDNELTPSPAPQDIPTNPSEEPSENPQAVSGLPEVYRCEDDDDSFFAPVGSYYKVMAIELPQIIVWEDGRWGMIETLHGSHYGYITEDFRITKARVVYLDSYDESGKLIDSVVKVEYEDTSARDHAMMDYPYFPEDYGYEASDSYDEGFYTYVADTANRLNEYYGATLRHMGTRTFYYTLSKNIDARMPCDYYFEVADSNYIRVFMFVSSDTLWDCLDESGSYSGTLTYMVDCSRGGYYPTEIEDPSSIEAKVYGEAHMPN